MSYLFFDTETTGVDSSARIVQLGAILTDAAGKTRAELNLLIKPEGWTIPQEATAIHGITTENCERWGVQLGMVRPLFTDLCYQAGKGVAHNLAFDRRILHQEGFLLSWSIGFCTMEASTPVLQLPPTPRMLAAGRRHYKSPTIQEAYRHFFGRDFDGAHDAMADVRACRDVFFALEKLKMPEPEPSRN